MDYPPGFDKNRAVELGRLVDAAYAQYDERAGASTGWQPAGYHIQAVLQAKEGVAFVPFGFVATKG